MVTSSISVLYSKTGRLAPSLQDAARLSQTCKKLNSSFRDNFTLGILCNRFNETINLNQRNLVARGVAECEAWKGKYQKSEADLQSVKKYGVKVTVKIARLGESVQKNPRSRLLGVDLDMPSGYVHPNVLAERLGNIIAVDAEGISVRWGSGRLSSGLDDRDLLYHPRQ